jgi:transposase InsO family protein
LYPCGFLGGTSVYNDKLGNLYKIKVDTIHKAMARRNTNLPLVIHSDRDSQYISSAYRNATKRMQLSYSKKAFP